MPSWKKLITSGSAASLSSLTLDTALPVSEGGTGATSLTSNGILTGNGTSAIQAESNLTFDGNTLTTDALIIDGGGTYAAGSIYSDSNWGMLFRAKQASPSQAEFRWADSADSELMRIDSSGNVGIATDSPDYELDVAGDIGMNAILYHNGDDNTYLKFDTDRVRMSAGGETLLDLYEDGTQDYVKLGDGGDVDINLNDDMFIEGSSGNVGIGTILPDSFVHISASVGSSTASLHVEGSGSEVFAVDGTNGRLFTVTDELSGSLFSANTIAGLPVIEAFSDYKVTLGPYSSQTTVDSSGNLSVSGEIRATGDVIAYYSSDERFKDNIQPIQDSLYKISKIGGYEYDWNDKQSTYEGHDVGVIAQEIHKVLPEVVTEREDGYLAVKYEKVVPLLIESIKELKQEVDDIKKNCKCLSDGNEL